ncbi:exonuclease domain-containing protein [Nocardia sp. CC227C]|uniref:exonuclease domain-containing protein n=1 Tax=Nocardia sp. CC227C TaxID=3044562 RepID=UPI00278C5408|nr:exonuclease domain-containing protein [Nocardia sp. CC227C]
MTSWTERPLACADLETTGIVIGTDRVVTAYNGRINGADVTPRRWLADPGIDIPAAATEVHGITTEYARKHGRPHTDVIAEVVDDLYQIWDAGHVIAVFNGGFDFSMLASHHPGFEIRGPIFDAYVVDKHFDKWRKGRRKLVDVGAHYGVRPETAHDAEGDALVAARLAWKMPRVYPELARYTPDELMTAQTDWYREQAYSFIDYLRRHNKPFTDVQTSWPLYTPKVHAA